MFMLRDMLKSYSRSMQALDCNRFYEDPKAEGRCDCCLRLLVAWHYLRQRDNELSVVLAREVLVRSCLAGVVFACVVL